MLSGNGTLHVVGKNRHGQGELDLAVGPTGTIPTPARESLVFEDETGILVGSYGLVVESGIKWSDLVHGDSLQLRVRVVNGTGDCPRGAKGTLVFGHAASGRRFLGLTLCGKPFSWESPTAEEATFSVCTGLGACGEQWEVSGTWQTVQSNTYHATWTFEQSGTTVTGSVVIPQAEAATQHFTGTVGRIVKGSLDGSELDVVVQWPKRTDGTVISGEYRGTVQAGSKPGTGVVYDGEAWNIADPSRKVTWTGSGDASCVKGCG